MGRHRRRATALFVVLVGCVGAGEGLAQQVPRSAGARTSRTIVRLAQSELRRGVREIPDGSNRAPAIRRYETATAGAAYGAPWCAYFVSYIAKQAGVPIGPGGRGLGYVPYIRAWARQTGRWSSRPRAGELIVFPQHVGIVENVFANHTLTTIEGNHSNAVTRVYRRWSEATGYVRLANGNAAPLPPKAKPTLPEPPARPLPPLRPRITAYPGTAIAVGQTIQFTSNDSSGDIEKSEWDLDGNGKFDAKGDNVGRTYKKAGTFTVTLRVTDARGRKATAREQILVRPNVAPNASFTVSSDDLVVGGTVTADASASHDPDGEIVKYEWDLDGDGHWSEDGVRHSLAYDVAGDYYAGLRVTDNDGNVSEVHVPIHVAEAPDPQSRIVCETTEIPVKQALRCSADDSGSPTRVVKHEWDMDDDGASDSRGTSVRWTYRKPGTYTIHLTVTDKRGRSSQTTQDVHVTNRPPAASLRGPATLAVGQSGSYDASKSSDADGYIAAFAWSLADARGASSALPGSGRYLRFTPSKPGVYTLAVAVSDDAGDSAKATVTVTVTGEAPVAKIALPADPFVAGKPSLVDASGSTSAYGPIAEYAWDLDGDGTYETTGAKLTITPSSSGSATLRLRVTDSYGQTATAEATVRVKAPPQPLLTAPATATARQPVTFSSTGSSDPDGRIVSYAWDFDGDGVVDRTTTTRGSTTWTFANAGSFLVTLTATDNDGITATATATVVVSSDQVLTPTVARPL